MVIFYNSFVIGLDQDVMIGLKEGKCIDMKHGSYGQEKSGNNCVF